MSYVPQLPRNRAFATFAITAVSAIATAAAFSFAVQAQPPALITRPILVSTTTISVDAGANKRAIAPGVYGVAYATTAQLSDMNVPVNRYGGNNLSRYNWQQNADNKAADYFFESSDYDDPSSVAGHRMDAYITATRNAGVGAQPMITIPMVGYVAKLGANRAKLASFLVSKYGEQQNKDAGFPGSPAGNGVKLDGSLVTGNDPLDANIVSDSTFQQGWVQHLVTTFGTSANGGVRYYLYDNEPSLWHSTHRDVHPTGATMDEIYNKMVDYGTKIRAVDSGATLVGPEEWGWSGYFYSGYDQQVQKWSNPPDRAAHGGMDYLPWLLDKLHKNEVATGKRLLDVFTVHYYPQGGEYGSDTSTAMQLLRNKSTRALWDPTYVDQSWINDKVQLIPRIKGWVNTYYPGIKTGITEYNWGADAHINGATTQADILGIFGREGLDIAARWVVPDTTTPTYKAFKMYRNYDGNKSTFGDTSVSASAPNPDNLSAFAATRSADGALTVMVINKVLTGTTPATVSVSNFASGTTAQVYQLTSANTITRLGDATVTNGSVSATLPAQSITLFVIPKGTNQAITFTTSATATPATLPAKSTTKITLAVKNTGGPATHMLMDMEIYNAAGTLVNQQTTDGQSFTSGQTRNYNYNWTPTTAGTYTVKIGIFKSGWNPLYNWNNGATTITVQ